MARKQHAGERYEREPDEKITEINPDDLATAESAAQAEKFPADLKAAYDLLSKVSAEPVSNHEEWQAKQPRLKALKAHIFKLGQGLPVCPPNANDHAAGWAQRLACEERQVLEQLATRTPAIRAMLDENAALKKQIADLTA